MRVLYRLTKVLSLSPTRTRKWLKNKYVKL